MSFFRRFQSGQSMVEMVVAVGMVSLVLVAIVSGIALSIRNSRYSKNKALATRYAQEALEKFRNYRDEVGWSPFVSEVIGGGTQAIYCLDDLPATIGLIGEAMGTCSSEKITNTSGATEFSREAQAEMVNGSVEVTVLVEWTEGSKTHNVELVSRLNDWTL